MAKSRTGAQQTTSNGRGRAKKPLAKTKTSRTTKATTTASRHKKTTAATKAAGASRRTPKSAPKAAAKAATRSAARAVAKSAPKAKAAAKAAKATPKAKAKSRDRLAAGRSSGRKDVTLKGRGRAAKPPKRKAAGKTLGADRRQLELPFLSTGKTASKALAKAAKAKAAAKAAKAARSTQSVRPEKPRQAAKAQKTTPVPAKPVPPKPVPAKPKKPKALPPAHDVSPLAVSFARLHAKLEQEEQRRVDAAAAAEAAARAMPVGVRRGRITPRSEQNDETPPTSRSHNFDALDRALAAAAVVADAESMRGYLNPWLDGRDVLAFVPADRAALIGCGSVAVADRKKVLIVLPSEESVREQVLVLGSAGIIAKTLPNQADERADVLASLKGTDGLSLIVSLEQLLRDEILDEVRPLGFDLLVIDEGQRVSELAPDFDPSLERVADLAPRLGRPPTLALLRAVPPSVRSDLPHRLGLRNALRVDLSPVHDTLVLDVQTTDPARRLALLTDELRASSLPAVVLGYSMADVNEIQNTLLQSGFDARRLDGSGRPSLLELTAPVVWVVVTGRVSTPIQCANTLIHYRTPSSLEQYCRDLGWVTHVTGHSRSLMLVASDDESLVKGSLERQRPRAEDLAAIATVLVRHGNNASTVLIDSLCPSVGMNRARVESLVGVFARAGWIDHSQDWVRLRPDCPDLVERARGLGARLKTAKERDTQRLRSMSAYVISRGCRQESLRRHFGTAGSRPCGLCDACRSGRVISGQNVSRSNDETPVSSRVAPVELRSDPQQPQPTQPTQQPPIDNGPTSREPTPPPVRRRIIRV